MFFVLFCAAIFIILFYSLQEVNLHWKNKKVLHSDPWPFVGNMMPFALGQISLFHLVEKFYKLNSQFRYFGIYQFLQPILIINDIDLIKRICIKDFDYFIDHKSFFNETDEPVFHKNLFGSKGQEWRELRVLLSPAFTGSKMRAMFTLITDCAERFTNHFEQKAKSQPNQLIHVEMKDVCKKFTTDSIGTCAFGIESDSLADETNEFYVKGKDIGSFSGIRAIKCLGFMIIPKLMRLFRIRFVKKEHIDFFSSLVNKSITFREKNNIVRPDLLHLMMEARKGRLKFEEPNSTANETNFASIEESEDVKQWNTGNLKIDDDLIVAQSILFFIGGSDSTAITLCFAAHELALHPEIQKRLQEEIDEVFEKNNGKISYEIIMKMKYLDMVVSETLRLWPQAFILDRLCVKDYTIEATEPGEETITIEKGNVIWVPTIGIHKDPKYYPNPEKFDPERFSDENKSSIQPYTYVPFGLGPRSCIGNRFALLVTKTLLIQFLYKFNIVVTKNTQIPIKLCKTEIIINPERGFNLGFELRKK